MGRRGQEKAEDEYRARRLVTDVAGRPRRGLRGGPRHPGVVFPSVPEPLWVGGTAHGVSRRACPASVATPPGAAECLVGR